MTSPYPFRAVEKKWQNHWETHKTHSVPDASSKPNAYVLEMLPYPSGRLHMGHVRNYSIGDAMARFMAARGYNVLHPMGWDAFGLPAENAAMERGIHPQGWTLHNIEEMRAQLKALGFAYDWDREIATCLPEYYGLEQRIFLDFLAKGLIYRKESWVNWDPVDNCVLANEQVVNGRGWRSGALVERRKLNQWSIRITQYAQELLDELPSLKGWPEKLLKMQENWIGRSEGAHIHFDIAGHAGETLEVFTTRPDTLFGASFCAIAAAHPLAEKAAHTNPALHTFLETCNRMVTTEEAISTVEKEGMFTGFYAVHPFDETIKLPIYVANFVLMDYGTGAIFGCPAHDARDFEFATKYNLPIKPVVSRPEGEPLPYMGDGTLVDSGFMTDLGVDAAKKAAIAELKNRNKGEGQTTYRLRDWSVSRQRYWGCPIPIIYCESCGAVPVPAADLPVLLPEDATFDKPGNPLEHHPTWKHVDCPCCGQAAVRDTDTLDTFFESSWYFLRYCSPADAAPFNKTVAEGWAPVNWYVGGIEHAVLHLLYARFFTKALRDCGYININEPFQNLLTQGMVCHETYKDGGGNWLYPSEVDKHSNGSAVKRGTAEPVTVGRAEKMSKSKRNTVDPQAMIESYGADAARLFILSDTPPERDFDWNDEALDGAWRYINRVWRLVSDVRSQEPRSGNATILKTAHQYLAKLTHAYETNAFNKVIAFNRELARAIEDALKTADTQALNTAADFLVQTLAPIAPHLCHELWALHHPEGVLFAAPWPTLDASLAAQDSITLAVQVNGKLRGTLEVATDITEDALKAMALELPTVVAHLGGGAPQKVIVVPRKIVNIVV
jgi:leucyl-tRNA synthetase